VKRGPIFLIILLSMFSFCAQSQELPLSDPLSIASQDEHEHESFPDPDVKSFVLALVK